MKQYLTIIFAETGDVYYFMNVENHRKDEIFTLVIDYPVEKIEFPSRPKASLSDQQSDIKICVSKISEEKTLVEVKNHNGKFFFDYIKKSFLKKSNGYLEYQEDIKIELREKSDIFTLRVHSSYSYISALRSFSWASFNGKKFRPIDLSFITLYESGIMKIDWKLEVLEHQRLNNLYEIAFIPIFKSFKPNESNVLHEEKILRYAHFNQYNHTRFSEYKNDNFSEKGYEWLDYLSFNLKNKKYDHNFSLEKILFCEIDIKDLLMNSCFYLSARSDITPIVVLQNIVRSFVFCDCYGYKYEKEILVELEEKLSSQNFKKIKSFSLDENFLKTPLLYYIRRNYLPFAFDEIYQIYEPNLYAYLYKMRNLLRFSSFHLKNAKLSIWKKNNILYSLLYLNADNSAAFYSLYVLNDIVPKAICELLPDGGSFGENSLIHIPCKFRMPEYAIGHNYSLCNREDYELIADGFEYFGLGGSGCSEFVKLYRRREFINQ